MAVGTLTIYGRNDNPTTAILDDKTTVETGVEGTDWWKFEREVYFVEPNIDDRSETVRYLNGYEFSYNKFRMKYSLKFKPIDFPKTSTPITTLFPFLDVIGKNYLWLHFNDYKIEITSNQTTKCLRVNSAGSSNIETQSGKKRFVAEFTDIKPNRDYS